MNNLGIDLINASKPLRSISLKIIGNENDDPELYLNVMSNEDQPPNLIELTLGAATTNVKPTVEFMICYSYGNYSNLYDLCDSENTHKLTSAEGVCSKQFGLNVDPDQKQSIEQNPFIYVIGTTPQSTLIVDLSQAVTSDTPDSSCPT